MSRQDKLSILFLMLFVSIGVIGITLVPDRKDRQRAWNSQTKRAIPPTAGKTVQHENSAPAQAYDNTAPREKLRPEETLEGTNNQEKPPTRSTRIEAKPGASGWLTEAEKKKAKGKIWELNVEGFQTAFSQHREELFECFKEWKESGDSPPPSFMMRMELETLFGEPYSAVQQVSLPLITSEKARMESCLGRVISPILFEAPPGDKMTVNIPMNFEMNTAKTGL